jgi:hypothetical protein
MDTPHDFLRRADAFLEEAYDHYASRVKQNLAHLGTEGGEWRALPFTMSQDEKGRTFPQHDFSGVDGYSPAPSLYRSQGPDAVCELCGKPKIKNVYHVAHHGKKWMMQVGSECVKHFGEGESGEHLEKEALARHAKHLLRQLHAASRSEQQVNPRTGLRGFPGTASGYRGESMRKIYNRAWQNTRYDASGHVGIAAEQRSEFPAVRWLSGNGKKAQELLKHYENQDLSAHEHTRDHSWMDWKKQE